MTADDKAAQRLAAYRAAWATFWANMATLGGIVTEDFPDGGKDGIVPTKYQVEAIKDLGNRLGALVEGYQTPPPF
jgi:hypothetical protein